MGTVERRQLDATSWVDLHRGWLDDPESVYDAVAEHAPWRQGQVWAYDHLRGENGLSAFLRPSLAGPHPGLVAAHKRLRSTYGVELTGIGLSWYRDGRDGMGVHRDSDLRWCEQTLIAVVTLGATRPWLVAPARGPGATLDLQPEAGDLLVMGGRAQADWLHGVPPAPGVREGRISLQWRWTSRSGRPETGGGSRAPRRYGSGR